MRTANTLLVAALAVAVAGSAHAAEYSVSVKTYALSGCCEDQAAGASPVSIEGTIGHSTGWYDYAVAATIGTCDMNLYNHSEIQSGFLIGKLANSAVTYTDFIFTDGTGVPKNVSFSINLDVSGSAAYTGAGSPLSACAFAHASVGVSAQSIVAEWVPVGGLWTCPSSSSGPFAAETGEVIAGTFTFGPFVATTEQATGIVLSTALVALPEVGNGGDWIDVDTSFELGFATATPAFTLPPGFTVNSAEAEVVDGWFEGNTVYAPVASAGRMASLAQNRPNPLSSHTAIEFTLTEPSAVTLHVLDASGRLVDKLERGMRAAGTHRAAWDGRDRNGRVVPAGVYFYRFEHAGGVETRKMTVLR